jgi:hypothetical protein
MKLPREIVLNILAFLSPDDLFKVCTVCKQWSNITLDKRLRQLVEERNFYFDKGVKFYIILYKISIIRLKTLPQNLSLSDNGLTLTFEAAEMEWQTGRTRLGYKTGMHYWEISLDLLDGGTNSW